MDQQWPRDQIAGELNALFSSGATRDALAGRPGLIDLLPAEIVPPEASLPEKARVLEDILRESVQLRADGNDEPSEHVRAANELLGWTEFSPDEIRSLLRESYEFGSKTLSELKKVDLTSLGVRYVLAGACFTGRLTSQRAVRDRRPEIARHLADAVQDTLNDDNALRRLGALPPGACPDGDEASTTDTDASNGAGDVRRGLTRRGGLVAVLLAAGVLIGAVATVLSMQLTASDSPSSNAAQTPPPPVRLATVQHTEGKGLKTYFGPGNTYPEGRNPPSYPEGDVIAVVCQERNGQEIYDPEGDPSRYQKPWPVWNKLSNGLWVSDLYTDLPKVPGDTPPDGIPRC
jgi:hypothetical protein